MMSVSDKLIGTDKHSKIAPIIIPIMNSHMMNESKNRPSGSTGKHKYKSELQKYQGMRWNDVFDFEKILGQLRTAEKQLKTPATNVNSENKVLNQVKCLSGNDMPYFGIAPKQDEKVVVVCEICKRTTKIVGLNNHMMLHHPTVWSSVPNKVATLPTHIDSPMHFKDNKDSQADQSSNSLSEVSTSSLSAATSSLSLAHGSSSRSKGSNSGRPRSKGKHGPPGEGNYVIPKISKKHSSSAIASNSKSISINSNAFEADHAVPLFSSSSNSSGSLPALQKLNAVHALEASSSLLVHDSMTRGMIDTKEKLSIDATVIFSKKKTKSPSFIGQESIDSTTSSSSGEYDRTGSHGTATPKLSNPKTNKIPAAIARTINRGNAHHFEKHISELDRAVSSITGGQGERLEPISSPSVVESTDPKLIVFYKRKKSSGISGTTTNFKTDKSHNSSNSSTNTKSHSHSHSNSNSFNGVSSNHTAQVSSRGREEKTSHHSSSSLDDKAHSTVDAADRKSVHHSKERSNKLSEKVQISRDEKVENKQKLVSQPSAEIPQKLGHYTQPQLKRMRYDESSSGERHHKVSKKVVPTVHPESQPHVVYEEPQTAYVQQHVLPAETENKIIKEEKVQEYATIDAFQLQQLLYEEQQSLQKQETYDYCSIMDENVLLQQQQKQQHTVYEQEIDEENDVKPEIEKCSNYNDFVHSYDVQTCNLLAATFQIYDIPSLTDDDVEESNGTNQLNKIQQITIPQYVLPANEDHIMFEITANNEVTLVGQSREPIKSELRLPHKIEETSQEADQITTEMPFNDTNNLLQNVFDTENFDMANFDVVRCHSHGHKVSSHDHQRHIKKERSLATLQTQEDFSTKVFNYPCLPRPLAMNNFGLVKYPQGVAAPFRKTVLNARKANNSPTTLTGAGVHANPRFANTHNKLPSNCFTSLPSISGNTLNEFSFSSITISNAPAIIQPPSSSYTLHRLHSSTSGMDYLYNPSGSASPVMQSTSTHRARSKPLSSFGLSSFSGPLKHTPMTVVTPMIQSSSFSVNTSQQVGKTIHTSSSATSSDRQNFTKRSIINDSNVSSESNTTSSNQLSDMLNYGKSLWLQTDPGDSNDDRSESVEADNCDQINKFYDRRQNLRPMTDNGHITRKLQLQQQLKRTFSDCSLDNLSQCKNNTKQTTDIFV